MLLGSFRVFFRYMPVMYHSFAYPTKQFDSLEKLAGTMRRDIVSFLLDNLAQLQAYDYLLGRTVARVDGAHGCAEEKGGLACVFARERATFHSLGL